MALRKRNLLVVLLLTLVTLGIYYLVWLYKTRKELLSVNDDKNAIPSFWLLFLPCLAFFILFIPLIAVSPDDMSDAAAAFLGIFTILLAVGTIALNLWWYYRYCQILTKVTKGMDVTTSYVLFIVLNFFSVGFVWIMLAQNDINKAIENGDDTLTQKPVEPPYPTFPSENTPPSAAIAPATPDVVNLPSSQEDNTNRDQQSHNEQTVPHHAAPRPNAPTVSLHAPQPSTRNSHEQ